MDNNDILSTDVCILGAGAAGLATALKLPPNNNITVIANSRAGMSASAMAQCGVAAAVAADDTTDAHALDTTSAGYGLGNKEVIADFVAGSVAELDWLEQQGVNFNKQPNGTFSLRKDSGHNAARVFHVNDETGKAIMTVLQRNVRKSKNINSLYDHAVVDFIADGGEIKAVKLLNVTTKEYLVVKAKCFIIATGGASGVFARHTNLARPIGSGIALAWRAGCSVANMEFQHFHPTCFNYPRLPSLMISGSLHINGSNLLYANGNKFMPAYDSNGEFLPEDVASRMIFKYKRDTGENVYIDMTGKQKKWLKNSCPTFYRNCFFYGVNAAKEKIPVFPAAHYTCGGIMVDGNCLTNIKNLYAVGEAAYTGLHGADRLCANSLMECIVFATKAADHISDNINNFKIQSDDVEVVDCKGEDLVCKEYKNYVHNIQAIMWESVGIVRSNDGLLHAKEELLKLKDKIDKIDLSSAPCTHILELRNMVLTALIITQSAISRKESRGSHYNKDYPRPEKSYDGSVSVLSPSLISFDEVALA